MSALAAQVVLGLLRAVRDHVPALVISVPHGLGEGSTGDSLDSSSVGDITFSEVLITLVVPLRRHVLELNISGIVESFTKVVPQLFAVDVMLGTVGDLLDQPGANHADVGQVVTAVVPDDAGEHAHDGAQHADQGQGRELVYNLDTKEDDGPHDEEQNSTIHPVVVKHNRIIIQIWSKQ